MKLSPKAMDIYTQISQENTKLGDLRKIAKEIKKDHELKQSVNPWSEIRPDVRCKAGLEEGEQACLLSFKKRNGLLKACKFCS